MLMNLHVKNMALIEEADIDFTSGLNILTGETGAGKSIVIGSVLLALGGKATQDIIRKGAEYATASLLFSIDTKEQIQKLKALDVEELEEGELLITRKIAEGRSTIKVNGNNVTAAQMKKIAAVLIDIHGQQEHQSLLDEKKHLETIDKYLSKEALEVKEAVREEYRNYSQLRKKYEELDIDEEQRKREIAFMQFEVDEIDQADLKAGEDEALEAKYRKMENSQKIMGEMTEIDDCMCQSTYGNASDLVSKAVRSIGSIVNFDAELEPLQQQLMDIENLLNDFGRDLAGYMEDMEFDGEAYEQLGERLDLVNSLKMKYGGSIEEVLSYRDGKAARLEEYENLDQQRAKVEAELKQSEGRLEELCSKLTDYRKTFADKLSEDITKALIELNFLDVRFATEFSRNEAFSANGVDFARFMISTNPGEDLKPLAKIASGGEMSRIMLAIKTVLADKDEIATLIFDEIDTGISGRTAQMVGRKLYQIAASHQIICITHLPQIAAMADTHFMIEKRVENQTTITHIDRLNQENSIAELARLLGGQSITEAVLNNAREMKETAHQGV